MNPHGDKFFRLYVSRGIPPGEGLGSVQRILRARLTLAMRFAFPTESVHSVPSHTLLEVHQTPWGPKLGHKVHLVTSNPDGELAVVSPEGILHYLSIEQSLGVGDEKKRTLVAKVAPHWLALFSWPRPVRARVANVNPDTLPVRHVTLPLSRHECADVMIHDIVCVALDDDVVFVSSRVRLRMR